MTEAEAKTKLKLLILDTEEPVLSDAQVVDCLTYARRPDSNDFDHSDAAWEPTWDLDAAAAEGWRRKAGIAASQFSFGEDGQRFERAQVYANCLSQAEQFARRAMGSIPVSTT